MDKFPNELLIHVLSRLESTGVARSRQVAPLLMPRFFLHTTLFRFVSDGMR